MIYLACVFLVHIGHWLVLQREMVVKATRENRRVSEYTPSICGPKAYPLEEKYFSVTGPTNTVETPLMMTAINSILLRSKRLVPIQWPQPSQSSYQQYDMFGLTQQRGKERSAAIRCLIKTTLEMLLLKRLSQVAQGTQQSIPMKPMVFCFLGFFWKHLFHQIQTMWLLLYLKE